MGASTAYTNLYNGSGMVYVTGPSGVFPAPDGERKFYSYPDLAFMNVPENATNVKTWAILNTPENGSGYASFQITITNAAADNCTSVLVNGVGQTAGAVAMTVGDTTASAASIAAAISAHVPGAGPNYRAINIGPLIIGLSDIIGTGTNGDVVLPAFSGESTATYTDVGGGRDSGVGLIRIFIDSSAGASESVMGGAAIEITEWLSYRALQSGRLFIAASVVASAVQFERSSQDMTVVLSNNATLTNIVSLGVIEGDRITLQGNGADTQVVTASATIGLASGVAYTLTGASTKITLEWGTAGSKWNEVSRASVADAAQVRASGSAIPLQSGVYQMTPAAIATKFTPGQTGVSGGAAIYEHDIAFVGAPVILLGGISIALDETNAIPGDKFTVSGNSVPVDIGAFGINFSDVTGLRASVTAEMALSGEWTATGIYQAYDPIALGPIVSWTINAKFSSSAQPFIVGSMVVAKSLDGDVITNYTINGDKKLSDGSVTEVKLDAAVVSKLNRRASTALNTVAVVINAVDGDILFVDVTAGLVQINLNILLAPTQIIRVVLLDPSLSGNTINISDLDVAITISGAAFTTLVLPYDTVTLIGNGLEWVIFSQMP